MDEDKEQTCLGRNVVVFMKKGCISAKRDIDIYAYIGSCTGTLVHVHVS